MQLISQAENPLPPPRILRIFSRYQNYGGEEDVVWRVHAELAELMEADWFESSTAEFLGKSFRSRLAAPFTAIHNSAIYKRLREAQRKRDYVAWEIHNVFPALSPSVYAAAFELDIPIVHFLHNYRLSCVNGQFLNHGTPCTRCIDGNFWPAVRTVCWRNDRIACAVMGFTLTRVRRLQVFEKVAAWIVLSDAQKQLHLRMGLPERTLHIVPHFLSVEREKPSEIPEDGYALFLGRLSPEKGVKQLLNAWKKIRSPHARLVIAGKGFGEKEIRSLVRDLPTVDFRGFVDRPRHEDLWAKAKFLIVPSIWHEPFGLVALEAMAHGRPLVVSNLGALPEIAGEAGLVVDPTRTDELAAACDTLFANHALAQRMGYSGFARLKQHYNRELWVERIKQVYASCGVNL
jgi:glycosyltransferase involved in cell wall biosynthesis